MEPIRTIIDPLLLGELANRNAKKHNAGYNSAKLAEEAAELSLVLQQAALKPTKVKQEEITDELGDVFLRLEMFLLANPSLIPHVRERIAKKQNSYREWLSTGRYELI